MQHTLIAVFDNRGDAQAALDELITAGFSRQEVRLTEGDPTAGGSAIAATDTDTSDTSIGASIKNFFLNLFGTDDSEHASRYSAAVTHGHYVLTLTAPDEPEVERAADIVERHGPVDIDETSALWSGAGTPAAGARQQAASMSQQSAGSVQGQAQGNVQGGVQGSQQRAQTATDATGTAIPVIQEELRVGKRAVERGGVRIFKRVVETPVQETVALREEHVNVERRPVNQPIDPADVAAFEEKSIELHETAEEPVVQKTARVVEEVVVGKEVQERTEQISDTVRHTEVDIERLAGQADDDYYRSHWQSNYASSGSYDDFVPAYSYGNSMAGSDQYRGRRWDEVEPTLRTDWESRYPDSAWERVKAAVRHGWERVKS